MPRYAPIVMKRRGEECSGEGGRIMKGKRHGDTWKKDQKPMRGGAARGQDDWRLGSEDERSV
ncbi:hypothetical protein PRIPAC_87101 [Pristionchus pacificus]|uniref:Uncharacterized protein n=1 Tax=Pristionchus pacificus TaxID=54126 RepID=A0A2A6CXS2_PRIPA|nr:hypothetical protein PRIPAC_87101 [Pristionchus pacificus]|eukprot:PDM82823.1 hypothetical protein PRIPAC_37216 [Pristionchus pacificus]